MVQADTSSVAEAIAGAGRSVGQGLAGIADRLERRKEEQKREQTNAKSADTLFKANPDLQKALGMDEHTFMGLPRAERIAAVAGGISHLTLQQANAKARREQEEYDRQTGSAQALQEAAGAAGRAGMERYYEYPEEFPQGPPRFEQAMFAHPAMVNAPNFNEFARATQPAPRAPALGPEALKQFGFVPTGGQVNPNGSASITFGQPPPQYPTTAKPILTEDGQPTGKATFEGKTIDLSPPNAEGKTLTQSENQMLGALNQASSDLDNLEKIFKKLGKDWGGPLAGRALNAAGMGQNPDIVAVENAINAATPNLARGVFREVGVLTDEDIRRYKALLPTAYDTDAVRSVKMKQLRERIDQGKKETMDSLRKAGRDLSGFDKAAKAEAATKVPPGAAGKTHAQLIEEANAAIQGGADEAKVRERLKQLGVEVK